MVCVGFWCLVVLDLKLNSVFVVNCCSLASLIPMRHDLQINLRLLFIPGFCQF